MLRTIVRGSRERGQLRAREGAHVGGVPGVCHACSGSLSGSGVTLRLRAWLRPVSVGGVGVGGVAGGGAVAGDRAHYLDVWVSWCLGAGSGPRPVITQS